MTPTLADATFAEQIEAVAAGEIIEACMIGKFGMYDNDEPPDRRIHPELIGAVLSWAVARPLLDYPSVGDFGRFDCHAMYAWTASKVIFVGEYDTSTYVDCRPRHPVPGLIPVIEE